MCSCMQHIRLNIATHLDPGTDVDKMVIQPTFDSITIVIFFVWHELIFLFLWREYVRRCARGTLPMLAQREKTRLHCLVHLHGVLRYVLSKCNKLYQYSVKKCSSQSEDMSLVGALWYGSTWLYCENLKLKILQHPIWKTLNPDPESPIIIDLI